MNMLMTFIWLVILWYSIEPFTDYKKLEEICDEFIIRLKRNFV